MTVVIGLALLMGLLALGVAARGAITVCVLDVTKGRVSVRRGAISPRALSDIRDVTSKPAVERATLRIVRSAGRAELEIRGLVDADQRQRLRNVVGSTPLAKLANGPRRR
jgi:hypothetical protein